jgi:DNA-binding response OmpR family regulator
LDRDATVLALLPDVIRHRICEVDIDSVSAPEAALERVVLCRYNLIIADVRHVVPSQQRFVLALRDAARETPLLLTSVTDRVLIGALGDMANIVYLPKPFDRDELISVIRRLLGTSAAVEQRGTSADRDTSAHG